MRRFSFLFYILIIIILPVSIVLISSNMVLRVSETYTYHFNDSQVVEEVGSSVSGNEFAKAITDYFNKPGKDSFQVYEVNGEFKDPIFQENESKAMSRAKTVMTLTLLLGVVLFGAGIAIYIYLLSVADKGWLRFIGMVTMIITIAEIILIGFVLKQESIRNLLYNKLIGIELGKDTPLMIMLGSPFERTFVIFSSILALAITFILIYAHLGLTKEKRLFS